MRSYLSKEILVLGCGNILFGDDGFGPETVEFLQAKYTIPPNTGVFNTGLGVRKILFSIILSSRKPKKIIIVDAVDLGRKPGEIIYLDITDIPEIKIDDFSMHQLPTSNLLKELKDLCAVDVKVISVQVQHIPAEVSPGLSKIVKDAIPVACLRILQELKLAGEV